MKYLLMALTFVTTAFTEPSWFLTKYYTPLSYSVEFSYMRGDVSNGKVVRSGLFTPRYYYDLYSPESAYLARAINRVFSLGLLSPSQMEFDIYDEANKYIGYIGGKFWTSGKAKFVFSNEYGVDTGIAVLSSDSDQAVFSLLTSNGKFVGTLNGTLSGDLSKWELNLNQASDIDHRALKIFAAFISDFHDSFIRKPEVHYHYHNHKL